MLTLEGHKEIIIKWVESCNSSEQLLLLRDIVNEFIVKRFSVVPAVKSPTEKQERHWKISVSLVESELMEAIGVRSLQVAGGQ